LEEELKAPRDITLTLTLTLRLFLLEEELKAPREASINSFQQYIDAITELNTEMVKL